MSGAVPATGGDRWIVRSGRKRGRGKYLWCCSVDAAGNHHFEWRPTQGHAFRFHEEGVAEAVAYGRGGRVVKLRRAR